MKTRKIKQTQSNDLVCPRCSKDEIAEFQYSDTVDFRGLELDVEGLLRSKCVACGHTWESASQYAANNSTIKAAYGVERDRLRKQHGLLSGTEIVRIREQLGLNQREAASLFGGGYNAFNKYESGEVLQSLAMDKLLRLANVIGSPILEFLRAPSENRALISMPQVTIVHAPHMAPASSGVVATFAATQSTRSPARMSYANQQPNPNVRQAPHGYTTSAAVTATVFQLPQPINRAV